MNERDLERARAAIERVRPAIVEAQRVAAEAAPIVDSAQAATALAMAPLVSRIAERQREMALAMTPLASRIAERQREMALTMTPLVSRMAEHARQWLEALASRFRPLTAAVETMGRRMAEQLRTAFAAMSDRLSSAFETIRPAVNAVATRIVEFAHYLYERSTNRLADRMRSESRFDLSAAADSLERADRTLCEVVKADDHDYDAGESYEAAQSMRDAVGALEELARQVAYAPRDTLPKALKKLVRRRIISDWQAGAMNKAYNLRSETPGVGHGAGAASNKDARGVLWMVRCGCLDILDAAGIGTVSLAPHNRSSYPSSAAFGTGGA